MGSVALYGDEAEEKRHLIVIKKLIAELVCPEEEIRPLYEEELAKFKEYARIMVYLPLLTGRRVVEIYKSKQGRCGEVGK